MSESTEGTHFNTLGAKAMKSKHLNGLTSRRPAHPRQRRVASGQEMVPLWDVPDTDVDAARGLAVGPQNSELGTLKLRAVRSLSILEFSPSSSLHPLCQVPGSPPRTLSFASTKCTMASRRQSQG